MPSAERHWAYGLGRRRRGSPESEDLPPAAQTIEPLAEGRIRVQASPRRPRGVSLVASSGAAGSATAAPHRIVSLSPTATESLFAIGAGQQVIAVDDQSDYPKNGAEDVAVRLHPERRGDRRLQARPRRPLLRPERPRRDACAVSASGFWCRTRPRPSPTRTRRSPRSARSPATQSGPTYVVATMKKRIAGLVKAGTPRARGLTVYHELGPDYYSATSSTFIGKVYALFGLKNIADAADSAGRWLPAALGRVRRLAEPRPHRPRRHHVLRAEPEDGRVAARVVDRQGGAQRDDRADRRLDRLALGAADRQLRARGRGRARAPEAVSAQALDRGGGGVPPRRRPHRDPRRAGAHRPRRCPRLVPRTGSRSSTSTRSSRRRRRRSCGSSGCRGSCSAALVGAMLALAGASYQGVFRNPLADPYLLGVAAGAGLGATLAIVYAPAARVLGCPPGGVRRRRGRRRRCAYALGRSAGRGSRRRDARARRRRRSPRSSPRSRPSSSSSTPTRSSEVYSWILGRLADARLARRRARCCRTSSVAPSGSCCHRRLLDVLSVGDEEAASLGVHVGRVAARSSSSARRSGRPRRSPSAG